MSVEARLEDRGGKFHLAAAPSIERGGECMFARRAAAAHQRSPSPPQRPARGWRELGAAEHQKQKARKAMGKGKGGVGRQGGNEMSIGVGAVREDA